MNKKVIGLGFALLCVIAFGSCKPKQSAYKSVYEAAQERQIDIADAPRTTPEPLRVTPKATGNETVRKEKITAVLESDASGLKAYSVVIAAMSVKPNAESLKKRMEDDGYKIILVQNQQGMFRAIIASYDTKEQAVAKKNQILADFAVQGTMEALKAKYGIPFNDWWILQREY